MWLELGMLTESSDVAAMKGMRDTTARSELVLKDRIYTHALTKDCAIKKQESASAFLAGVALVVVEAWAPTTIVDTDFSFEATPHYKNRCVHSKEFTLRIIFIYNKNLLII